MFVQFSTSKTFYIQDWCNKLPHIPAVNEWLHMLELPRRNRSRLTQTAGSGKFLAQGFVAISQEFFPTSRLN